MSILVSVFILILVALIQTFMQLSPGVFALFYHYALGKKSRKKADSFSLYYILGYEFFIIATIFILCIFVFLINKAVTIDFALVYWILAGVSIAEAMAGLFFYYRKNKTTELFISRKLARSIEKQASNVKNSSDAFILGFVSGLPELIFTLPVYLTAIFTLIDFTIIPRATVLIAFIILAILPLIWIFILYHTDRHLADIARLRLKLKPFVKIVFCFCFLLLAIAIMLGNLNHG